MVDEVKCLLCVKVGAEGRGGGIVTTVSPLCYVAQTYGQLIREDNKLLDKTIVYEYNNIGCMNQNK